MTSIYLLTERLTGTILYVGKSINVNRRLVQHQRKYECEISLEILESDCLDWRISERYWITLFRDEFGFWITNKLDGGNEWPIAAAKLGGIVAMGNIGKRNRGKISKFKGKKRPEISASLIGKSHPHKNSRKNWTTKTSSKGGIGKRRVNDVMREFGISDRSKAREIYYSRKEVGYYND